MSEGSGIGSNNKRPEAGNLFRAITGMLCLPPLVVIAAGWPLGRLDWGLLLCYAASAGVADLWLLRRVCRPLRALERDLRALSKGEDPGPADSSGAPMILELQRQVRQMGAQVVRSRDRRLRTERTRQSMLADISHDLRTPITVIEGYARALRDGLIPPDQQDRYLHTVASRAEELAQLIDSFYQYSRLEHPDYALDRVPTDVCVFVRDWLAEKYRELDLLGHPLEADIPEVHVTALIDRLQLRRALENILANTLRYGGPGAGIWCSLQVEPHRLRLLLGDNGPGIPAHLRADLFEPFTVGEAARTRGGSGLGLAITRRILEAHGGAIVLTEAPAAPCTTQYILTLPLEE